MTKKDTWVEPPNSDEAAWRAYDAVGFYRQRLEVAHSTRGIEYAEALAYAERVFRNIASYGSHGGRESFAIEALAGAMLELGDRLGRTADRDVEARALEQRIALREQYAKGYRRRLEEAAKALRAKMTEDDPSMR